MRASEPADLPGPLAVVCHDAGAANLVIHWIGCDIVVPVRPFMAGPARLLWERALPDRPLLGSIEEALAGSACLLSGTGWATDIEHRARLLAAQARLPSVAVLDHWVNYPDRFERDGRIQWPDAMVVTDKWALREASRLFPRLPIVQWSNRYMQHEIAAITPPPIDGDILYICEPARSNWGMKRPGEFQAIDFFIDKLEIIDDGFLKRLRFRPHPSESREKYDAIISSLDYAVLDDSTTLGEAISRSRIVGGMSSAAMVVALGAGRRVYSSIPPWAPPCPLPHDGIVHLREVGGP